MGSGQGQEFWSWGDGLQRPATRCQSSYQDCFCIVKTSPTACEVVRMTNKLLPEGGPKPSPGKNERVLSSPAELRCSDVLKQHRHRKMRRKDGFRGGGEEAACRGLLEDADGVEDVLHLRASSAPRQSVRQPRRSVLEPGVELGWWARGDSSASSECWGQMRKQCQQGTQR